MPELHVLHSRAGRIGGRADTRPEDVDAIVAQLKADPRRHLVIHFHGGLVSKAAGMAIARKLQEVYSPTPDTGGYPLFFVWESGAWETVRNNITELADEPVFGQLLRKLTQYALERAGADDLLDVSRSALPGSIGAHEREVRQAFHQFWSDPRPATIPYRTAMPAMDGTQARAAGSSVEEDEIQADLEQDAELQRALATLPAAPDGARSAAAGASSAAQRHSAFAEIAAREFGSEAGARAFGAVQLFKVARFLARVLRAVLRRYGDKRHHGLYATCVEELIRAFRIAGSGANEWGKALQWNRMKQDVVDAFGPDPQRHAGTALLSRLGAALNDGLQLQRVTLVGHSTGAIYIAHWLEHAAKFLPPTLKQDVVFLAPAITYDRFAESLRQSAARIGNFRMFAMLDEYEMADQVWGADEELGETRDWRRFIYPASLLYLVSGILEDEADTPILGMERYYTNTSVYPDARFPGIAEARSWLQAAPHRLVWSRTGDVGGGLGSDCFDHGAFDNDAITVASLKHIVTR